MGRNWLGVSRYAKTGVNKINSKYKKIDVNKVKEISRLYLDEEKPFWIVISAK